MISQLIKYGGVSGKVHALYGHRLSAEDMSRLSAMSNVSEIAAYLKNHPGWEESLRDISLSDIHRGGLEDRLRDQLFVEYRKITRFLFRGDRPILRYINRAELDQLLLYLRYLKAGRPQDYTYSPPAGFDRYSRVDFARLSQCANYLDFLDIIRTSEFYKPLIAIPPAPGDAMPDYTAIESMLTNYFYHAFFRMTDKYYHGAVQKQLRKSIGSEIDVINITRAIRIRRYFPGLKSDIFSYLIPIFHKFKRPYLIDIANAPDDEAEASLLRSGPYGKIFSENDFDSVEEYYYDILYRYNYKSLYAGIPSVYTPIAYLSLKEVELKKLINIIEMVRYQVARSGSSPAGDLI